MLKRLMHHTKRFCTLSGCTVTSLALALFFFSAGSFAGETTLQWNPATQPGLAGYKVYYGPSSGNYTASIDAGAQTSHTVTGLSEGNTYYFAVTAYGTNGYSESGYSNEVSKSIPTPVAAPKANFNANPTSGIAGETIITFSDTSEGNITNWSWNFGNGTTGTGQSPEIAYNTAGTYTVSLTVSGPGGSDTKTEPNFITVSPASGGGGGGDTGGGDTGGGDTGGGDTGGGDTGGGDTGTPPTLETGEISVDSNWKRVNFGKAFTDPVVVAQPLNFDVADPGVIRIRNVDADGFEIRAQTWDYLGGAPLYGMVGYLVMEYGSRTLPDGTQVEAGRVNTNKTGRLFGATFQKPFGVPPVVITAVTSFNEADAVATRVKNVETSTFRVGMQEQEANPREHATETISYIAWEPSYGEIEGQNYFVARTESVVKHKFHTLDYPQPVAELPVFLADMQTRNGGDTANLRYRNKTLSSIDVMVAEEQSKNQETRHVGEAVGYMLFEATH